VDDQVFSDGIGTISVIGGTVRLDFVALSPTEREANGQPKAVFRQRIVMGVDGFLRSAAKVQEAVQALSKMGATAPQIANLHESATRPDEMTSSVTIAATPSVPAAVPTAAPQKTGTSRPPFP
jgi:hypothetical protein